MYKHYGLMGKTIKARHKQKGTDAYPWNGIAVPIKITREYPTFLIGVVLPHKAPMGIGSSLPYRISIHKHDIQLGTIIIEGGI